MIKDSYYIQGQKGEYITLKKDADDETENTKFDFFQILAPGRSF